MGRWVTPDRVMGQMHTVSKIAGLRSFAYAEPDPAFYPTDDFWMSLHSQSDNLVELMAYGPTQGDEVLRIELAATLLDQGINAGPSDILITTGATQAIAVAVRRVLMAEPSARLACVNVLKIARFALDETEDAQGRNPHLGRLVELKHWAREIPMPPERITYHVLESTDPASQLIDYARHNRVDHIVMGSRGSTMLRRHIGSVSARVVAEAPCTVTVARPALDREI